VAPIEPAIPSTDVIKKPLGPLPGVIAFAIKPATKPMRIVAMRCPCALPPEDVAERRLTESSHDGEPAAAHHAL
jgi:hypothetical protein